MAIRKHACRVDDAYRGWRLDQFLARALPDEGEPVSRRGIRRLIDRGAVYLDGKRVRVASKKVPGAATVEVFLGDAAPAGAEIGPESVLFEDEWLIAVDKPSGMPAQATVTDATSDLGSALARLLAERDGERPYLALHHRLDVGTSGVMVFAKHRRANAGLARAFAEKRVEKLYQALSAVVRPEVPEAPWTVEDRLAAPRRIEGVRRVEVVEEGGRPAVTELRLCRLFAGAAWMEARPATGRTHQVRVHLASAGLPVLGDAVYGDAVYGDATAPVRVPRLMLHAESLACEHPVTGTPLEITSPLPVDFRAVLSLLENEKRT